MKNPLKVIPAKTGILAFVLMNSRGGVRPYLPRVGIEDAWATGEVPKAKMDSGLRRNDAKGQSQSSEAFSTEGCAHAFEFHSPLEGESKRPSGFCESDSVGGAFLWHVPPQLACGLRPCLVVPPEEERPTLKGLLKKGLEWGFTRLGRGSPIGGTARCARRRRLRAAQALQGANSRFAAPISMLHRPTQSVPTLRLP